MFKNYSFNSLFIRVLATLFFVGITNGFHPEFNSFKNNFENRLNNNI